MSAIPSGLKNSGNPKITRSQVGLIRFEEVVVEIPSACENELKRPHRKLGRKSHATHN
jgi:hypothetical protein